MQVNKLEIQKQINAIDFTVENTMDKSAIKLIWDIWISVMFYKGGNFYDFLFGYSTHKAPS